MFLTAAEHGDSLTSSLRPRDWESVIGRRLGQLGVSRTSSPAPPEGKIVNLINKGIRHNLKQVVSS